MELDSKNSMGFLVIFLGFLLFSNIQCTKGHDHSQMKPGKSKSAAVMYQCPMHPQITAHKHGQSCPICGMNLVEIEREPELEPPMDESSPAEDQKSKASNKKEMTGIKGHEEPHSHGESDENKGKSKTKASAQADLTTHAPFRLSMDKRQMIGVKSEKVSRKHLFKKIKAAGSIAYDPDLFTARIEYQEALKQYLRLQKSPVNEIKQSAYSTLTAAKTRLKVLGLSDAQIKAIKSHRRLSEDLLFSDKTKNSTVYAEVFEVDLPFIRAGQSVEVRASFLRGRSLAGKVQSVDRIINRATRTAKVRILLNKTRASIRPDAYVDVVIYASVGEHLAIPFDAVLDTGLQSIVFVLKGDGYFEPRNVVISLRAGNDVAVEQGIKEGEKVVTSANFLIDSESRLKAVIRGARHAH